MHKSCKPTEPLRLPLGPPPTEHLLLPTGPPSIPSSSIASAFALSTPPIATNGITGPSQAHLFSGGIPYAPSLPVPPIATTSIPEPTQVRLFCGGLPYSYNENAIALLLSPYNPALVTSIYIMRDRRGRSKGCCFASVGQHLALRALSLLNGTRLVGQLSLNIKLANEQSPPPETPLPERTVRRTALPDPPQSIDGSKLFVGMLPYSLTKDDLQHIFEPFGEIVEVKLLCEKATGASKGAGFVTFRHEENAQAAIVGLDGSHALYTAGATFNKPLNVRFANQRPGSV